MRVYQGWAFLRQKDWVLELSLRDSYENDAKVDFPLAFSEDSGPNLDRERDKKVHIIRPEHYKLPGNRVNLKIILSESIQ